MSRTYDGILWTHNDSGNQPIVFAITPTGALVAALEVPNAVVRDWEDMAIGPCPSIVNGTRDCIYVADTGDNFERRRTAQIYVIPEPDPRVRGQRKTSPAHRFDFRFEDGPVDVEGLAVDQHGVAWLVTKGRHWPVKLYTLDLGRQPLGPHEARLAVLADTLGLPRVRLSGWVTGATMSPSAERLIVRTYVDIYSFRANRNGRWVPDKPVCHIGAIEPQGEAIDFVDENTFVLTSEALANRPGPIHRIVCP